MDGSAAIETVRQWVELALPALTAALKEEQPGRVDMPYATVGQVSARGLAATPHVLTTNVEVNPGEAYSHRQEITEPRMTTARIVFYGDDGPDLAEQLRLSVQVPAVRKLLRFGGVAVRQISDVVNTSVYRDTAWEASAQVDYAVHYTGEAETAVPVIESEDITVSITQGGS